MSSEKKYSPFRTLAFRLAVCFAGLFAMTSIVVFGALYLVLARELNQRGDEKLLAEIREIDAIYEADGLAGVSRELLREGPEGEDGVSVRLFGPDRATLVDNHPDAWRDIDAGPAMARPAGGKPVFETRAIHGSRHGIRVGYVVLSDGTVLEAGKQLKEEGYLLEHYLEMAIYIVAVMLTLVMIVGWFMASRAMRGVRHVAMAANNMGHGDLLQRVPVVGRGDEVDHLAESFNAMADRIQALIIKLKEVTSNIAHDLRTPVTRMRGRAEAALMHGGDDRGPDELASDVVEECDRLVGIIETILKIAEVEAGLAQVARTEVDLGEVVRDAADLFHAVAEERGVRLELKISPDDMTVSGNNSHLQRVVANLLDNAIKYTASGGRVRLGLETVPGQVVISISDTGVGIPEKDIPHVFERFYRCDPSRSTTGSGLGLSLVQALVKAHGGTIGVESELHKGSTFTVRLPRAVCVMADRNPVQG